MSLPDTLFKQMLAPKMSPLKPRPRSLDQKLEALPIRVPYQGLYCFGEMTVTHDIQNCDQPLVQEKVQFGCASTISFTFTFSHLADAFIQSDLHMCDLQCIHILHLH